VVDTVKNGGSAAGQGQKKSLHAPSTPSDSRRKRSIALIALSLAGIVFVWLWRHCGGDVAPNEAERSAAPLAQINTAASNSSEVSTERPLKASVPAAPPTIAKHQTEPRSYSEAFRLRGVERIRKRWEEGTPDRSWSRREFDAMNAEFANKGIHGVVSSADCRSTLCIVTMKFATGIAAQGVYLIEHAGDNDVFTHFVQDGDQTVVSYFIAPIGVIIQQIMDGPREP
jgi:hypothetical protein